MITQTYKIDLVPHGEPVVVHVSQYDTGARTLAFELYNGGVAYTVPANVTASVSGTKPDGTGFVYPLTVSGNVASLELEQQMALVAGDVPTEISLTGADGKISSANFIIRVERAALDEDTAISETDIPVFEQLVERAETAATEAGNAADAAEDAQAATEALFPAGGSSGQYLQKTASGTQWAEVDALPAGGTAGQVLTKQSSTDGDADWETPAYVPAGGTTGQVLTKTATGTGWETPAAGGGDIAVTFTYSNGVYSADKTYAEIADCINNGGTPYGVYSGNIYRLCIFDSSVAVFSMTQAGGWIGNFRITSEDAISYTVSAANTRLNITLVASNWVGNVYTVNSASILAPLNCDITVTLPDVTTEALKEAQIAEFAKYDLYPFNQTTGSISFYARGTVPTSDITLLLIIHRRY